MTINPLTISLVITLSAVLYVIAGWLTFKFLWHVRKWQNVYEDTERGFMCTIWPFTMTFWLFAYGGIFFWAFVTFPFRKIEKNLKVKKARIRRSGKAPRIVK